MFNYFVFQAFLYIRLEYKIKHFIHNHYHNHNTTQYTSICIQKQRQQKHKPKEPVKNLLRLLFFFFFQKIQGHKQKLDKVCVESLMFNFMIFLAFHKMIYSLDRITTGSAKYPFVFGKCFKKKVLNFFFFNWPI